ncbi:MAG: RidA family protein [Betaproteobacteria bacterium]
MHSQRDIQFETLARELGMEFQQEIRAVNNYQVAVRHKDEIYISGQLPRIGANVVVTGRVGAETSFEEAERAAQICILRALGILQQTLGTLDRIDKVLRLTVYVQSAADFTRQSEVADAASDILYSLLGTHGAHTRTSVGVFQLPKNGSVEIDLVAALVPNS